MQKKYTKQSTIKKAADSAGPSNLVADPNAQKIADSMQVFTVETLKEYYQAIKGVPAKSFMKETLCNELGRLLNFKTQSAFDTFLASFPECTQELIIQGTYNRYVNISPLEEKYATPIIVESPHRYYFQSQFDVDTNLRAMIFSVVHKKILYLPKQFRTAFAPWVPRPSKFIPQPIDNPEGEIWTIAHSTEEILSLLIENIPQALKRLGPEETARKGLLKDTIRSMHASCGLKNFPIASRYGLHSVELVTRFVGYMERKAIKQPSDATEYIKGLIKRFFTLRKTSYGQPTYEGLFLEAVALTDHLKCTPTNLYQSMNQFQFRKTLRLILSNIANTGKWFSVSALGLSEFVQDALIAHPNEYFSALKFRKGELLRLDGLEIIPRNQDKGFYPVGFFQFPLLDLPLFKAYLYLFAALGLVDVIEKEPELLISDNGKESPISPYDALSYVRVNEFGAWCLDMRNSKPEHKKLEFETITDSDLLLVTFRGQSLQRKLFLEQIGEHMGEERYRVNEISFMRGCISTSQLLQRIEKFRNMINPTPSSRWELFFTNLISRSIAFSQPTACSLYELPSDPVVKELLLKNPQLRKLIIRAENNSIVVRQRDVKTFLKLISKLGFLEMKE